MSFKKIGFIGLGLIGGSIAKTLKRLYPEKKLYATSGHLSTVTEAFNDHTIENDTLLSLSEIGSCDLIFLCTPVQKNIEYLRQLQPVLKPGSIITDVGSVKSDIHEAAEQLHMNHCFIGGHPMAGNKQQQGIAANGLAYGTRRRGGLQEAGQLAVGDGLAVGNSAESSPHVPAVGRALRQQLGLGWQCLVAEVG